MENGTWLVVVPDTAKGAAAAATLIPAARHVLRHASGRPWLLGCWPENEAQVAAAGGTRIAVIGRCSVTAGDLAASLRRMRRPADTDIVVGRLSGCFHLVISSDGWTRAQGSIAQMRRLFYTRVDGATLAADRADLLACLVGADVDEAGLAGRLMFPPAPPPLDGRSLWKGIEAVPGDCYLQLDRRGCGQVVRWWRPPTPHLPLAEAAAGVRQALQAAVSVRTRAGGPVSADLSGGLDSTSLCFLAAGQGVPPVTYRQEAADPGNQDGLWAQQAAAALPDARHVVVGRDELPGRYAGLDDQRTDPEEPFTWVRSRADLSAVGGRMAATGAWLHLGGHGGDEIFTAPPSYLHTVVRTHPLQGIRQLRGLQAVRCWSTRATVSALADRGDYRRWLRRHAGLLTGPPPTRTTPRFSWGTPFRMPPWASAHAVELAHVLIRQAVADAEPLAPLRVHHQMLSGAALCGRSARLANRLFTAAGTCLEVPYLDDRVIEAGLSALLHHHTDPRRYKPLLAAAMAGVVPPAILTRTTKGEFSADTYVGFRRHRGQLLRLTQDCLLAERGLINSDALRAAVLAPHPTADPLWVLDMTIACELWLRTQPGARPAGIRNDRSRVIAGSPLSGGSACP